jgi:hypothetical protein
MVERHYTPTPKLSTLKTRLLHKSKLSPEFSSLDPRPSTLNPQPSALSQDVCRGWSEAGQGTGAGQRLGEGIDLCWVLVPSSGRLRGVFQ